MPKPSEYDKTHLRNMAAIGTRIDRIFKKAADEAAKIGVQIKELHPEHLFSFDDYPETKKQIERLMAALRQSTTAAIASGIRQSWTLSNNKNNTLAQQVLTDQFDALTEAQRKRYFSTNGAALDAFIQRREQGMNLSDRVWKYTNEFKEEIELGLDLGIRSGKPAAEMARDLRQYLQHPDMMFRRFRVRKENGYGHRWKRRVTDPDTGKVRWENFNPRDFHPGRGVYRSSYKNARRLAVTETNIAYRTSDHLRWQQMDFVVGIRIVLSNNHTLNGVAFTDICDRLSSTKPGDGKGLYPKDFKFVGWHPHCRCHMETVLKTEEEMEADTQRILNGEPTTTDSVNKVRDTPAEYKQFAKEFNARNEERAAMGLSPLGTPYFIRDNRAYYDTAIGLKKTIAQQAAERHAARTPQEIQDIKDRWEARSHDPLIIAANRHAARTPEDIKRIQEAWNAKLERDRLTRKKAEAVFKVAQDFQTDIDNKTWLAMEEAIKSGNLTAMNRMTKPFATDIKALQNRLKALKDADIIADLEGNHTVWSLSDLEAVQASIEQQLANFKVKGYGDFALDTDLANLQKLKKSLEFQAKLAVKNQDKYATWEVAEHSWLKLADKAQDLIDWQPIKTEIANLTTYKTKSKVFQDILDKAVEAQAAGDKKMAQFYTQQAEYKKNSLETAKAKTAAKRAAKTGDITSSGDAVAVDFKPLSKVEIDRLLNEFEDDTITVAKIDKRLRPETEAIWGTLTHEERLVLTKYTQTYHYLNEPLRGMTYSGLVPKSEYTHDLPILTNALAKFRASKNMVVRRGVKNFPIPELGGKMIGSVDVGDVFTDGGFLSTAAHKDKGFFQSHEMIIVVPKGAQGAFAEPFTHYNGGFYDYQIDKLWDGKTKKRRGSEFEWIGQRGCQFRVIKKTGYRIFLELIGQLK